MPVNNILTDAILALVGWVSATTRPKLAIYNPYAHSIATLLNFRLHYQSGASTLTILYKDMVRSLARSNRSSNEHKLLALTLNIT